MEIIISDTVIVALSSLGGVLIGGTITFVTQYYLSKTERKNKNKALLRDKYEEISMTFIESTKWLATLRNIKSIEEFLDATPKDAEKVYMLAVLYIPELEDAAEAYMNASVTLLHCSMKAYNSQDEANALMQSYENGEFVKVNSTLENSKERMFEALKAHVITYCRIN